MANITPLGTTNVSGRQVLSFEDGDHTYHEVWDGDDQLFTIYGVPADPLIFEAALIAYDVGMKRGNAHGRAALQLELRKLLGA